LIVDWLIVGLVCGNKMSEKELLPCGIEKVTVPIVPAVLLSIELGSGVSELDVGELVVLPDCKRI